MTPLLAVPSLYRQFRQARIALFCTVRMTAPQEPTSAPIGGSRIRDGAW
jgi:hypothetical protein